jgi:hypothetical protein
MRKHSHGSARVFASVLMGAALTVTMGAASVWAGPKSSFVGDFDLVEQGTGVVVGHITASVFEPTAQRLVPGSYDFVGASGNAIKESHGVLGSSGFWFDPNHPEADLGGSTVAFASGAECIYFGPNDTFCHEWAVMFIDVVDPSFPDQVAFAGRDPVTGDWAFDYWFWVGSGEFHLRLAGD